MPLVTVPVNGFWKRKNKMQGEQLCFSLLEQARNPIFYEKWGVPDTLEGRFDCASLHLALLLRYLQGPLAQVVFDTFFSYTEMTLRELGVSDLGVGKQVKKCARFFYGALNAYEQALEQEKGLEEALLCHLYGNAGKPLLSGIVAYIKACNAILRVQDFTQTIVIQWPHVDNE